MEAAQLSATVQELTDIELAVLLSLVAGQHCIIQTEEEAIDLLEQELQLVASNVFGLSYAVLRCTESTNLDDFGSGILVENPSDNRYDDLRAPTSNRADEAPAPHRRAPTSRLRKQSIPLKPPNGEDNREIANVIIARDLNLCSRNVQIQALELLRTNRILSHTALHTAPKLFCFIVLKSITGPPLLNYLNDFMFISHYHDPEDGFPNLDISENAQDDRASLSSIIRNTASPTPPSPSTSPAISQDDIHTLTTLTSHVTTTAEVKRYLQNIVVFLRLHRAVDSGISPQATKHFDLLVKCLAPLHALDFVTPSLVALAARKIYPHRIKITSPENERSMQYGSDLAAVTEMLEGVTAEDVVEEVLESVEAPL